MTATSESLHSREAQFHNTWASQTDLSTIDVTRAFEAPTALENRFILDLLGPLSGKRIIDVGAGLGESSIYFALKGAKVTCTDLSPAMVSLVSHLAARHGVQVDPVVAAAEDLKVASSEFDIAYVANTIHHVADKHSLFRELRRVLKPGGVFVSIDPIRYNPLINIYRRMATAVRTDDEAPLDFAVPAM